MEKNSRLLQTVTIDITKWVIQRIEQNFFFFFVPATAAAPGSMPILIASSNTSCIPCKVLAEHSMYLTAPILRCAFKPSVNVSGVLPSSFSRASVASSFLRSDLVPISISGVAGQWY